jgi:hypothetical protein
MPARGRHLIRTLGAGVASDEQVVRGALERSGGCVAVAARELGFAVRSTLWYHLRRLGLERLPRQIRQARRARLFFDDPRHGGT